jgi:hypothetical protein
MVLRREPVMRAGGTEEPWMADHQRVVRCEAVAAGALASCRPAPRAGRCNRPVAAENLRAVPRRAARRVPPPAPRRL